MELEVHCVDSSSVLPGCSYSTHTRGSDRGSERGGFGPAGLVPLWYLKSWWYQIPLSTWGSQEGAGGLVVFHRSSTLLEEAHIPTRCITIPFNNSRQDTPQCRASPGYVVYIIYADNVYVCCMEPYQTSHLQYLHMVGPGKIGVFVSWGSPRASLKLVCTTLRRLR